MIAILPRLDGQRRKLALAVASVLVVGTTLIVLFATGGTSHGATPTATTATPVSVQRVIDATIDLTMSPPSSSTSRGLLSPDAAWALYAASAGYSEPTVPSRLTVIVGNLTEPVNSSAPQPQWQYAAQNELTYAYFMPNVGCLHSGPPLPEDQAGCTEWTFLDANSGAHVLTDYVPTDPAASSSAG